MRILTGITIFAIAWLVWSGHYTPLLLVLGVVSCFLATWVAKRTGFFDGDVYTLHLGRRLVALWLWLLKEIVRANIEVARIVLTPGLRIQPTIVNVDARDLPPACQAILANAITLTPGTASIDISDGRIRVHCLSERIAESLRDGEMLRRARKLVQE